MNSDFKASPTSKLPHRAEVRLTMNGNHGQAHGPVSVEPCKGKMIDVVRRLVDQGHYKAAEILIRNVLGISNESFVATEVYLDLRLTLSFVLRKQGNFIEAEAICREVIDRRRNTIGRLSDETVNSIYALARLFRAKNDWRTGEVELRSLLEEQNGCHGPGHDDTLWTHHVLGGFLAASGN